MSALLKPAPVERARSDVGLAERTVTEALPRSGPATEGESVASAAAPRAPAEATVPWRRYLVRALALVGALLLWQAASASRLQFIINFQNIPTPLVVGERLIGLLGTTHFYVHIGVSIRRILISFVLATLLGVSVGVLMGRSRLAADIVMPYIETLRPIPAVAWIPLAILMFPTEESSIIYITFLGAFFPIVLNTVHGVQQTPETLVRAAMSFGANRRAILWHVVLPGALPSIVAGLAIGMGVAWFSLLAGEIISGQYGIGYFTWTSYTLVEYPQIIIGMLTIGGLGTLSTWLVRQASKPALRWQEQRD
ncbi:MAG TPA: ABC transporter permease [Burkholderiaceae bacterium]|nr:ABC transporter permease [Burkholderiaceae bacterium]